MASSMSIKVTLAVFRCGLAVFHVLFVVAVFEVWSLSYRILDEFFQVCLACFAHHTLLIFIPDQCKLS